MKAPTVQPQDLAGDKGKLSLKLLVSLTFERSLNFASRDLF